MPKFLQPTVSGGELSPGLAGRVDTARYATSVRLCRNYITKPTGGAAKRPGRRFRGRVKFGDKTTRIIPFIYSTLVKYLVEVGDLYFRFWVNGALLTKTPIPISSVSNANPAAVGSVGHGLQTGMHVLMAGLVGGLSRLNGRTFQITVTGPNSFNLNGADTTADPVYIGSGTDSVAQVVEVATPYTEAMVPDIKYTQSADVLFLTHPLVPIKELRRLTGDSFELRDFAFRRGPFRQFNVDEAAIMAVSGTQGAVNVTTNVDVFTAAMVGSLIYIEEKELRSIKPWASGERGVTIGSLRRSDQKVYKAVSVPTSLGGVGTPYYITGGSRPTHATGRAFDGPQDIKSDGVNSYATGVEWEFIHNTFGILQVVSYTNPRLVSATVIERVPDSIVGTAPAPAAGPFPFVGDGVTTVFATPGITSDNPVDFVVTLNGAPTQSNPNYPGGGGVGGGGGGNPRPGNNELGAIRLE